MYPASVEYLNRQAIIPNWGGGLWEQGYIYCFPFSSFCEYVRVCFCVRFCLHCFPFTICPRGLSVHFFVCLLFCIVFGTCYHCCICFLVVEILVTLFLLSFFLFFFFYYFKKILFNYFFNNFTVLYCIVFYLLLSFSSFLPFILSHVNDRLLVLQPGIRAVPLRWESQVQDIGPQETSQLHVISNGENLPEISISTPRPRSTQWPASYSAGHLMSNN